MRQLLSCPFTAIQDFDLSIELGSLIRNFKIVANWKGVYVRMEVR